MKRHVRSAAMAGAGLLVCLGAMPGRAASAPPPGPVAATPATPSAGSTASIGAKSAACVHAAASGSAVALPAGTSPPCRPARPLRHTIYLAKKILAPDSDLAALRTELVARLAELNAPPPAQYQADPSTGQAAGPSAEPAPPSRKLCPPSFDMAGWQGSGDFSVRLAQLRARIAASRAAPAALAALAEFDLSHGLAGEALEAAREAMPGDAASAETARLRLDADLARLTAGLQISATSPLLGNPAACDRPDLGLWQALAAAAAHDPAGVARFTAAGATALRGMPEPLRDMLAYRLADAVEDGSKVLANLGEAMRDAEPVTQEDRAALMLLQARLAPAHGDRSRARDLLQHAAETGRFLPSLQARVRLAAGDASGDDGPFSAQDEAVLADAARTYRDTALGQGAAAALADRKLRDGDFPAALTIADESARADGAQHRMNKSGAAIIATILRTLLVTPGQHRLPAPAERIAAYLRYQGYATPGPQGDDIRLGAARLMLDEGLPAAALDAARQLTAPAAGSAEGLLVRATAEAVAGDPASALALLHDAPPDPGLHRAASMALARLGKPDEAARQLDGLTGIPDRLRRAALLGEAKAWSDAASAYADLLRDPALSDDARHEASDRYGLALVLSGGHPDPALSLAGDSLAARALAALPATETGAGAEATGRGAVAAVRGALRRARATDTLLPATPSQGV